jgi:ABC-type Fe3+-hydroxamate transport system substrate-binding protein
MGVQQLIRQASGQGLSTRYQPRRGRMVFLVFFLLVLSTLSWAARIEKDDSGRVVAVPEHVRRIVSLSPSLTDVVYALGAQNELVAITEYTDYPPQAAHEKPSVGPIVNPSLEKIVGLHPDVVLALPAFNGADTITGLQRLGIPVVQFNTTSIKDIYRNIATAGRVLGREREAATLIASLQAREKRVREQSVGRPTPSLLVVVALDPLITAGSKAFLTEMITAAGARSVTADLPQDWLQMNLEAVLARKPEYILLIKHGPVTLKDMQQRSGWRTLEAVQKDRVITVDNRIQIPGPVAFDGLEALAAQLRATQSH